ncbi:hypothetical protein IIC68_03725 [archaeon]|nr:hypothetical protein [archaeon]
MKDRIINSKTKEEVKKAVKNGNVARVNFCSVEKPGEKCAKYVEKQLNADVRGTLANREEKSSGKCIICNKPANEIVYIGKSY